MRDGRTCHDVRRRHHGLHHRCPGVGDRRRRRTRSVASRSRPRWIGARRRNGQRPGTAHLRTRTGRNRDRRLSRQCVDLHPGQVRGTRREDSAGRRRSQTRTGDRGRGSCSRRACSGDTHVLGTCGDRGPARGAGVLHPLRHRHAVRDRVRGPLQLRPHRCPVDRSETRLGQNHRRRSRTSPFEHPRQRVFDRCTRLHRRHAHPPRTRRTEPRRLRLPDHSGVR